MPRPVDALSNPGFAPTLSQINLPITTINTSGTAVTSTGVDVSGTFTVTSADSYTTYVNDSFSIFHVYGNTTALMPKLSYHIHLGTGIDLLNSIGLSCPYVTNTSAKPMCDK